MARAAHAAGASRSPTATRRAAAAAALLAGCLLASSAAAQDAPGAVPPPPIPMVRQPAYPVLAPLGVVAASVGMVIGLVAANISVFNGGSHACDSFGCRRLADNDGSIAVAAIGGGAALAGVGLIIAGATLDGPIVPSVSPPRPPPPAPPPPRERRGDLQIQMRRVF